MKELIMGLHLRKNMVNLKTGTESKVKKIFNDVALVAPLTVLTLIATSMLISGCVDSTGGGDPTVTSTSTTDIPHGAGTGAGIATVPVEYQAKVTEMVEAAAKSGQDLSVPVYSQEGEYLAHALVPGGYNTEEIWTNYADKVIDIRVQFKLTAETNVVETAIAQSTAAVETATATPPAAVQEAIAGLSSEALISTFNDAVTAATKAGHNTTCHIPVPTSNGEGTHIIDVNIIGNGGSSHEDRVMLAMIDFSNKCDALVIAQDYF